MEKDEDIYALEKAALGKADTKQSSLACKLLSLWAHGLLSATMIREIASCALDDGAQHEELVHLAEAGSWGQQPGNIHRSILRRFCKDVGLEKPISVSVPCIDNKTTLEKVEQAQIYLPHLVFAGLAENSPSFFEDSMSLKHLEKFWLQVEKSGDDKLLGHPMTLEKAWMSKNIPLFAAWGWGRVPEQRQPADIQLWSFGLGKGNDLPGGQPLPGSIPQKLYP